MRHRLIAFFLLISAAAPAQTLVPDGAKRTVAPWAAKGLMQNPVAICLDPQGNLYVAESDRAGNAVADTRGLGRLNAVEEDLQFKSVEDRRAQIKRWVAGGAFPPDFFTKTEDRVRIVRDTDGDGVADWSGVFAGGFNDEVDGIGAGVLWLNNAMYYTCIPNLWVLKPGVDPYKAESRTSLANGFGVRWCFYGHDLHGLTPGPDGRIYFSMGDRGFNVTTKEGRHLVGVDRGGVFRCWPDGSELELYYQGLRNPQCLAFDELGDLFTGDNNCDSGDKARIVQIVEGGDSGWRQDVQSLDSRGPWNREHTWETLKDSSGARRPAWALPPVEYMGDGPSGLRLYPGTGESHAYDGCFFMVDFRGSVSIVHAFRCEPQGAGYKLADHVEYFRGVTVTDIAWGYDGRLYLSDWGGGWEPNPNGNIFTIRNETVRENPAERQVIAEVQRLFRDGFAQRQDEELLGLLRHRDSRVRLAAQYELASRGPRVVAALGRLAESAQRAPTRAHAIWCLGQIARMIGAAETLVSLLESADAENRAQAARTLGDVGGDAATRSAAKFIAMLKDESPRVRLHAATALGRLAYAGAMAPLLSALDENANTDLVLRHAYAHALSRMNQADELLRHWREVGAPARLGMVLALRAEGNPDVSRFLDDPDPLVAVESARAVYDTRVNMPVLAGMLDRPIPPGRAIEPWMRRAIEANVLVGTDACVDRLIRVAEDEQIDSEWRELALERLEGWDQRLKREGVWGNWVDLAPRPQDAVRAAVRANIALVLARASSASRVFLRARRLEAKYNLDTTEIITRLNDEASGAEYRFALLNELDRRNADEIAPICESLLATSGDGRLRTRAQEILVKRDPPRAVPYIAQSVESGGLRERQQAVRLLGTIGTDEAGRILAELAQRLAAGRLDDAIALDVYESAMKLPAGPSRDEVVAAASAPGRAAGFATSLLRAGGDVGAGQRVFEHHAAAECVRCHTVDGKGGNAGPNLSSVGSRLSLDKLIESVVEPGATIAEGYGLVTAMPEMSRILTPAEARDVVAYLRSLRRAPVAQAREHAEKKSEGGGGRYFLLILVPLLIAVTWRGVTRRTVPT